MKYEVIGGSMQAVRISLDVGEKIYSDSGKLVSKSKSVVMEPKMVGGIVGAIERKMTGATGFLTQFTAKDQPGHVTVAGVLPGKIYQLALGEGEDFIAEHYAFIAADDTVKFTMQTIGVGGAFFGGAGLILQKFVGPGNVFLHITGDVVEYNVTEDNPLEIDPGHIAGFDSSLNYKITFIDNIKTAMFGGVGLFLAKFEGNGKVVAHSVSRLKMASELYLQGRESTKGK